MFESTHLMTRYIRGPAAQRGSALIIALVFLLVMTLIGTTAMQGTSQQENMASNMRDRNLAFQAAEAALREGVGMANPAANPIPALYDDQSTPNNLGAFWTAYFVNNPSVTYIGNLTEVSQQPDYVIEDRTVGTAAIQNDPVCLDPNLSCFRITARGIGGTPNAIVILQMTFYQVQ